MDILRDGLISGGAGGTAGGGLRFLPGSVLLALERIFCVNGSQRLAGGGHFSGRYHTVYALVDRQPFQGAGGFGFVPSGGILLPLYKQSLRLWTADSRRWRQLEKATLSRRIGGRVKEWITGISVDEIVTSR